MLDLTDVARIATLLIPPLALFAALCAFLVGLAGSGRSGKTGRAAWLRAATRGDTLPQALLAAASVARTMVAFAAVLATGVLATACIRNDRSFTALRSLPTGRDTAARLLALATTPQGAMILALLLLGLVGIAPARLIAATTTRIGAPLLAALAACLCIWPLDPFARTIPIVERSVADAGTQYGAAVLAVGVAGVCAAFCLRPILRAARDAAPPVLAVGAPLSRAQRLAALEQEVRATRERSTHERRPDAAVASHPAPGAARSTHGTAASHCTRCQALLPSGAEFCTGCGHSVVGTPDRASAGCRACGAPRAADDRFCARCGVPLAAPTVAEGGLLA